MKTQKQQKPVYFLSDSLMTAMLPEGGDLLNESAEKVVNTIQGIVVVLMGLIGAHTPQVERPEE